jgi:hypothetical protein
MLEYERSGTGILKGEKKLALRAEDILKGEKELALRAEVKGVISEGEKELEELKKLKDED